MSDNLKNIAEDLCGHAVDDVRIHDGGGNSRIYRVVGFGQVYALKRYPDRKSDMRPRQKTEQHALQFMAAHEVTSVPAFISGDKEERYALLEWVDGQLIGDTANAADVIDAVAFLKRIASLRESPEADTFKEASEACLSGQEIIRQIDKRIDRLKATCSSDSRLNDFLSQEIVPRFEDFHRQAQDGYGKMGMDFSAALPRTDQALIPADFGFHNVLRTAQGRSVYIDFEYFGWDDPVKLASDFIHHPGVNIAMALKRKFADLMGSAFAYSRHFDQRLILLHPLFGVRWALILLNEFLPDVWERRQNARVLEDWETAKANQLQKAAKMLSQLTEFGEVWRAHTK